MIMNKKKAILFMILGATILFAFQNFFFQPTYAENENLISESDNTIIQNTVNFEKAAETYLTALSTNKELNVVSDEIAEKTAQETADYPINLAQLHLDQIKKILDKEEPDYKN